MMAVYYGQVKGRKYPANQPEPPIKPKDRKKTCAACGVEKKLDNFGTDCDEPDGYSNVCRLCKMLNRKAVE